MTSDFQSHPLRNQLGTDFAIEERVSESVLDSVYESKYEGYESSKQKTPLRSKRVPGTRPAMGGAVSSSRTPRRPFSPTTRLSVGKQSQPNTDALLLQETYTPRVHLSLSAKGFESKLNDGASDYQTIMLDT